jgi:flavin reductase (DIM6/NTAB) family NADH-FMN oxidoreductase RutF
MEPPGEYRARLARAIPTLVNSGANRAESAVTLVTAVDDRAFRALLGRFSTGVTVLTTETPAGVHGMTANAFVAVSLRPPLVLVCVDNDARMRGHLDTGAALGISILAAEQEALSSHFAGRPKQETAAEFKWHEGVPLIRGALAHLTCHIESRHEAGDHRMYVCRVTGGGFRDGEPLIFFQGAYHRIRRDFTPGAA